VNILLVDDSVLARTKLESILSTHHDRNHFHFFTAENGLVALDILHKNSIDIIFLDWNMPVMSGEELVYKLREDKKYNKTRIIMATTEGGKDAVVKMAKKGVNGYLVKPFDADAVLKTFTAVSARLPIKG